MKRFALIALALLLAAQGPHSVAGQADEPEDAAKDPREDPQFVLFRTAGRTWTLKRIPYPGNEGGDTEATFHRTEVVAVHADFFEIGTSTSPRLESDGVDGMNIAKVKFDKDAFLFKPTVGFKKSKDEKLTVPAGTFDCVKYTDAGGASEWRSKQFPGLLVASDDRFGRRELVKFDRIDGDPGADQPKARTPRQPRAKAKDAEASKDEHRLFAKRGRKWFMKVSIFSGAPDKRVRRYESIQFEVKTSSEKDREATLEVVRLTLQRERIRGQEPVTTVVKFDNISDHTQPPERSREDRVERRLTPAGIFTCTVYTFQDAEGRQGLAWYAKEWPGLLVRRQIVGDRYHELHELTEFPG